MPLLVARPTRRPIQVSSYFRRLRCAAAAAVPFHEFEIEEVAAAAPRQMALFSSQFSAEECSFQTFGSLQPVRSFGKPRQWGHARDIPPNRFQGFRPPRPPQRKQARAFAEMWHGSRSRPHSGRHMFARKPHDNNKNATRCRRHAAAFYGEEKHLAAAQRRPAEKRGKAKGKPSNDAPKTRTTLRAPSAQNRQQDSAHCEK